MAEMSAAMVPALSMVLPSTMELSLICMVYAVFSCVAVTSACVGPAAALSIKLHCTCNYHINTAHVTHSQ